MKLVGLFVASSHGQLLPKLEFKGMPVPGPDRTLIDSLFSFKILARIEILIRMKLIF
jgi:hypothetical protein